MAQRDTASVSHTSASWLVSRVRSLTQLVWPTTPAHLSDDQVLTLTVDSADGRPADTMASRHLASCRRCDRRAREAADQLRTLAEIATTGFDETFTPSALHAQRTRIGRRLDRLVGTAAPVRLLDFPFSRPPRHRVHASSSGWMPAAVVGALLLGLTAGQLIHLHPADSGSSATTTSAIDGRNAVQRPSDPSAKDARPTRLSAAQGLGPDMDMTGTIELPPLPGDYNGPLTLDAFAQVMPDEAFLGSLDVALTSTQVSELASIDALTPRVRDLAINIR